MPAKPKRLMPTKPGWWWYRPVFQCEPGIALVAADRNWRQEPLVAWLPGESMYCHLEFFEWLGPVNPEPLKPEAR